MTTPAEIKSWFSSRIGRRATATDIADALGVSRNTANTRLGDGLDAGDTITVCRHFDINPVEALVELGHISHEEAFSFVDSDGTKLATASLEELIRQLAEDNLPLSDKIEMGAAAKALADRRDELTDRRAARAHSNDQGHPRPDREHDGTVRDFAYLDFAADDTIDEQQAREDEGSDPID
ncbi:hypothetical protein ACT3SZ_15610 [Corynebacterium sp. AOP40-9SA-29]|uniref:hypothetical protein n=1 Tax=Corynebacterium sp. AOP40-9SA-29 TaxID=3457677 RepID=UPI004033B2B3